MKLRKSFTKVTPFSKFLALSLLIICPIVAFFLGIEYHKTPPTSTNEWKTYTNTKYRFTVDYPATSEWSERNQDGKITAVHTANMQTTNDRKEPLETTDSVLFSLDAPIANPVVFYISIMTDPAPPERDNTIYNSLSQSVIDKIFTLQIGEELDEATTKKIDGDWPNLGGLYKRLPDAQSNDINFLVIENPKAYGGIDRRLLWRKEGYIFMTSRTYTEEKYLKEFEQFYSTFKFIN